MPLALAYAAGFLLVWPRAHRAQHRLAPAGRMALTNYLIHSLSGLIFFYGTGFGLAGEFHPLRFYAIAVMICAAQIVFSRWWLDYHKQLPMEAVRRRAT